VHDGQDSGEFSSAIAFGMRRCLGTQDDGRTRRRERVRWASLLREVSEHFPPFLMVVYGFVRALSWQMDADRKES